MTVIEELDLMNQELAALKAGEDAVPATVQGISSQTGFIDNEVEQMNAELLSLRSPEPDAPSLQQQSQGVENLYGPAPPNPNMPYGDEVISQADLTGQMPEPKETFEQTEVKRKFNDSFKSMIVDPISSAVDSGSDSPPKISEAFFKNNPSLDKGAVETRSKEIWEAYQKAKWAVGFDAFDPGDRFNRRRGAKYVAGLVTDEDMPMILAAVQDLSSKKGANIGRGVLSKASSAFQSRMKEIAKLPESLIQDFFGDEKLNARTAQIESVLDGADPFAGKDAGWLEQSFVGAAGEAPALLMGQGVASLGGRMASALGAGKKLSSATSAVAAGAFYSPILIDDAYRDLISEGIEGDKAKTGALVSGAIESVIETLALNVILPAPLKKVVGKTFRSAFVTGMKERGLVFAKELLEEGAQGFVRSIAKDVQDDVDSDTWESLKSAATNGFNQAKGAIGTLMFLTGPGAVSHMVQASKVDAGTKAFSRMIALAPETAESMVETNPEIVDKVLSSENPSARKTIKEMSPQLSSALSDKASRETFVENLAKAKSDQVKKSQEVPQGQESAFRSMVIERAKQAGMDVPEAAQVQEPVSEQPEGSISVMGLEAKSRKGGSMLKSLTNEWFAKERGAPLVAWKANRDRVGQVNSDMSEIKFIRSDFIAATKKVFGKRNLTDEQQTFINDALGSGMEAIQALPEGLRDVVGRMRTQIDALSQKLIDLGIIDGELAVTVGKNKDVYLNRTYKAFTDKKWKTKVFKKHPEIVNKAVASIRQDFPDLDDDGVRGLVYSLLEVGKAGDSLVGALSGGKLGQKEAGILIKRSGIPKPIRDLLGEELNPYVNYAQSVGKIANLISTSEMYTTIKEAGRGVFLFDNATSNQNGKFIYPVNLAIQNEDPLYTTSEIAKALNEASEYKTLPVGWQAVFKMIGFSKMAQTVYSPQTQVRNFVANPFIAMANGNLRFWYGKESLMSNLASVNFNKKSKWREYFKKLQRLGVVSDTAQAGELQDMIRDASGDGSDQFLVKDTKRHLKSITNAAAEAYRIGDDFWKVYAFENEKAKYRKAYPEWNEDQLDEHAAEIVRNTVPTYSMIPKAIQTLRRIPVIAPFVSFAYEMYRTTFMSMRQIQKELSDPRTFSIGVQRAIGLSTMISSGTAMAAMSRYFLGVTKDEDEDNRKFVPHWSQNSDLIYLPRDEKGNRRYIDISYTNPYSYGTNPFKAFMRGEDWQAGLVGAIAEVLSPFISEELLFTQAADVARNTKKGGGSVWNATDSLGRRSWDIVSHLAQPLIVGAYKSGDRIYKGATGYVGDWGKEYNTDDEILAVVTGQRRSTINLKQSLGFKAGDYKRESSSAQKILTDVALRKGTVSAQELTKAYLESDSARRGVFNEMHESVAAAMRLGLSKADIQASLRDRKVSAIDVQSLISGSYTKYRPRRSFMSGLDRKERKERMNLILSLYPE